jgi:hypothetical protein
LRAPGIDVSWFPQVYGTPALPDEDATDFSNELQGRSRATLSDGDVLLVHTGEDQQFVPAILWERIVHSIPCLLYTALPDQREEVQVYLNSKVASPVHDSLPGRFYPELSEDWPRSRDGIALKKCVTEILSGIPPKDAVGSAFGDPELDRILDGLYAKLQGGPGHVDLGAIRKERDLQLEAHYEKTRGWRNPTIEEGGF